MKIALIAIALLISHFISWAIGLLMAAKYQKDRFDEIMKKP